MELCVQFKCIFVLEDRLESSLGITIDQSPKNWKQQHFYIKVLSFKRNLTKFPSHTKVYKLHVIMYYFRLRTSEYSNL